MHGGRIVHAVTEKADNVPHLLDGKDDPLLLIRLHLHKEIRRFGRAPQRFVGQTLKVRAREHAIGPQTDKGSDVLCDGPGQTPNGVGRVLLRPIEKREEADEDEIPLQLPAVRRPGLHRS